MSNALNLFIIISLPKNCNKSVICGPEPLPVNAFLTGFKTFPFPRFNSLQIESKILEKSNGVFEFNECNIDKNFEITNFSCSENSILETNSKYEF